MDKEGRIAPITYSFRQRLVINLSLAVLLLILAQLPWFLAGVCFGVGAMIYLATMVWALAKVSAPRLRGTKERLISKRFARPQLPQVNLFSVGLSDLSFGPISFWLRWLPAKVWALDELRFSLLLLTLSLLLGLFYFLSFIRFLNAHNGVTMFFLWEGLR